jgi:ketosteroid isomerase-like protein
MKRMIWCCVFLALLAGAGIEAQTTPAMAPAATAASSPADDAEVMKQIAEIRNGMVDALNKKDFDKVLTYLDKDIVVTWANAEVSHGPAEVKAYCDKMMNAPDKIVESIHANPAVEGRKFYGPDVLISYGTLGDEFTLTDGRKFNLNSRFSSLLVRENGVWKLKGFHASANVFDNPILGIAIRKVGLWVGIGAGVMGIGLGFVLGKMRAKKRA